MANEKVLPGTDYYTEHGYAGISQDEVNKLFKNKGNVSSSRLSARNADSIPANEVFGVSLLTELSIAIEGKDIPYYKDFTLKQSAVRHHEFALVLDFDALGMTEDHWMEQTKQLLGKRITVVFRYKNIPSGPKRDFVGVITHTGFTREYGNQGHIVLKGSSPTVLLDGAAHLQSFGGDNGIPLTTIAKDILKNGLGSKYSYRVEVDYYSNVPYSCQYNETHYNYLCRLAAMYGQQFYYNGNELQFGKLPSPEKPLTLTFGKDVDKIDIAMKTRHVNRMLYGYNSSDNEYLGVDNAPLKHQSSLAKDAYATSQKTYQTQSLQAAPVRAVTNGDMKAAHKGVTGRAGVEVFVTTGETCIPFLYPGCIADMYLRKPGSGEADYSTRLMITEIEHHVDGQGRYVGKFEAVAEGTGFMPSPEFDMPAAELQFAKVVGNADPLGQGRVQVEFDWQRIMGGVTAWIRVMAPDAGGSSAVSQNRGHVFIPEVGDQVMVGFVHHHPDRPFVLGGLFHGQIAAGGGANNAIKSIMTRSGIKIIFNDDQRSLHIEDPSGNTWDMDGNGNITVNAPKNITMIAGETFTMNAKNMQVFVEEDMGTQVGKNQQNSVGQSMDVAAGKLNENYANDVVTNIGGKNSVQVNDSELLISKDMIVQAGGKAFVQGAQDARISKKG